MTRQHSTQTRSRLACLMSLASVTILNYFLETQTYLSQSLPNKTTPTSKVLIAQRVTKDLSSPEIGRRRGGISHGNGCTNSTKPL